MHVYNVLCLVGLAIGLWVDTQGQVEAPYKWSKERIGPIGVMPQWNRTLVPTAANAAWDSLLFALPDRHP